MKSPQISVAIVTYNCSLVLREAIESVVNQKYDNKELVIIDGKSTDSTISIIKDYANKTPYIKWISEKDCGIYDAMNKALQIATGDYIIFLGADDHFMSHSVLSEVAKYIEDDNCVYYGNVFRNKRNDIYKGEFSKLMFSCENICHQCIFYPKSVYKNNQYDLKFPTLADYIYNIRIWNKVKFNYIPVCVSYFNCMGVSASGSSDEKYTKDFFYVVRENLGLISYIVKNIYKTVKR